MNNSTYIAMFIKERVKDLLVGQNPFEVNNLLKLLYNTRFGGVSP
jgi:hypothetical protein